MRMKDERGGMAHGNRLLPILTILRCGAVMLPEERKPPLFSRILVDQLQLIDTTIFLMVVINGQNRMQKVVFGPSWPKTESSPP